MPMPSPEEQRDYQKMWMRKRRAEWVESKGGKCEKCGSTEQLEIDHIDRSLKTIKASVLWSRNETVRAKELENCQLLCNACHKEKTRLEKMKDLKHGDYGMYKARGCRCQLCKDENARRVRLQRAGIPYTKEGN